jgi:hypothetical protein
MDSECFEKISTLYLADGIIVQPQQHVSEENEIFENTAKIIC